MRSIVKAKTKIFIDGSEGTTGLRIFERFEGREDIELLPIKSELRKDLAERKRLINQSDITFLCLPDAAARESVSLVENESVRVIDTSTAHRTQEGWAYGFPELSAKHRQQIQAGKRVAVPGCHATGFIALAYPMVTLGYSGGGKKMIAEYEAQDRHPDLDSPREYALSQNHKHLPEMQKVTGLSRMPLFSPIVADYYSGMVVSLPLYNELLHKHLTAEEIQEQLAKFYADQAFVQVMPFGAEEDQKNMMAGNRCTGWDGLRIYVTGNQDRTVLSAQFDNLGKGASGAAIQCLNIMLGCDEAKGLNL